MTCSLPRSGYFYQDILLRGTAEDLERRSGATLNELKTWRKLGLLSFDIMDDGNFRECEIVEAEFVARLVKSPLAAATVLGICSESHPLEGFYGMIDGRQIIQMSDPVVFEHI